MKPNSLEPATAYFLRKYPKSNQFRYESDSYLSIILTLHTSNKLKMHGHDILLYYPRTSLY